MTATTTTTPTGAREMISPTVLVVDDELGAAEAIQDLLAVRGVPCWVAADGLRAIELVNAHRPRTLLLDVALHDTTLDDWKWNG